MTYFSWDAGKKKETDNEKSPYSAFFFLYMQILFSEKAHAFES